MPTVITVDVICVTFTTPRRTGQDARSIQDSGSPRLRRVMKHNLLPAGKLSNLLDEGRTYDEICDYNELTLRHRPTRAIVRSQIIAFRLTRDSGI